VPTNAKPFDPTHLDCFTKFRMFQMHEFDKLVYLDADMIVVQEIDDLFSYPSFAAAPTFQLGKKKKGKIVPNSSKFSNSSFNAGMFVVDRDETLYDKLLAYYSNYDSRWSWADQSMLNEYFKGKWNAIPYYYNCMKRVFVHRPDLWHPDRIKIIHYTGGKPWQTEQELKEKDFEDNTPYKPIFELWQEAFEGRFPLRVPPAPEKSSSSTDE
jgi:lipopolysaccharide biosynthesis glycosyltransferase